MPLYDYICQDCNGRFEVFMSYAEYGRRRVICPQCKSRRVRRRMARVRLAKSESSRTEALVNGMPDMSDPAALQGLENDPRAMGSMMRRMSREMGEEMPPEFNEVVDRLEKGQSPEEIEKELPDLGVDGAAPDSSGE